MKILVTGAAGRFGGVVARWFFENGFEVLGADLSFRAGTPFKTRVVDLLRPETAYELIDGADIVVHLANHPNQYGATPQRIYNDNVGMNMNVFQASRDLKVGKVIFASSIQVICNCDQDPGPAAIRPRYLPFDEDIAPNPRNPYSLSKRASEEQLAYHVGTGLECGVVLRLPCLVQASASGVIDLSRRRHHRILGPSNLLYLTLEDGAALVGAIATADLTGCHLLLPAAHENSLALSADEVRNLHFPDLPVKNSENALTSLVDLSAIRRLVDWEPSRLVVTPPSAG